MTKAEYVLHYQDIAISEMDRSGIPASITLSQGILESRFGNSSLATEANNHFGIKCHVGWTGRTYYLKDDDLDNSGNLIESCFRAYSSAEQSFIDHSEFLMTRDRYAFLFGYDKQDYKLWAHGLKKAGYATNPKYGDILIRIIVDNNLARFDRMTSRVPVYNLPEKDETGNIVVAAPKAEDEEVEFEDSFPDIPEYGEVPAKPYASRKKVLKIYRVNDIKTVTAGPDETPLSLARRLNMSLSRLMKYNDLQLGDDLIPEQPVFLQPKRKRFRGRKAYHRVEEGETMYFISQKYGIKLKDLYRRNNLDFHDGLEPEVDERIFLKGRNNKRPKMKSGSYRPPPRFMQNRDVVETPAGPSGDESWMEKPEPVVRETPAPPNPEKYHLTPPVSRPVVTQPVTRPFSPETAEAAIPVTRVPKPPVTKEPEVIVIKPISEEISVVPATTIQTRTHEVESGDTLYNISRRYSINIDELKRKNGLNSNLIRIGQVLTIE